MRVQTLYEFPCKIKNKKIASYVYKINKAILNLFYPRLVKLDWGLDEDADFIVSMTSYPARINTIWITIATLLCQTRKPKQVILWLAKEQFPSELDDLPPKLLKMQEFGLEIRFCENLYSHKKYFYAMQEYSETTIITADDDVFYPENLLELLTDTAKKYPNAVCCTRAHETFINAAGMVESCDGWIDSDKMINKPSYAVIPTGIGGVLYPPHSLKSEVFNENRIREVCINADDLWLKFMSTLNHIKSVRVDTYNRIFYSILQTQKTGLHYENVGNHKSAEAWDKLMLLYPECAEIIKEEWLQK